MLITQQPMSENQLFLPSISNTFPPSQSHTKTIKRKALGIESSSNIKQ